MVRALFIFFGPIFLFYLIVPEPWSEALGIWFSGLWFFGLMFYADLRGLPAWVTRDRGQGDTKQNH
jgi:hypothetical protein